MENKPRSGSRHYEHWLKTYMEFTRDSESPASFHFWSGIWCIAGALRRRVWLDMRKFQWTPNFYIVIVGPPGVASKSTSMRSAVKLLEEVPGIKFGPQSMTWQKLAEVLSESMEYIEFGDPKDPTRIPMSAVSCAVGELGTFLKMEDSTLTDVLISLWDGQLETWGHHTRTSGAIDIKNPWVNIVGCTTPSWIEQHMPAGAIEGGLTSRIIFVYGDKKRQLVPYPDEVIPSREYNEMKKKLVEDLVQISELKGEYRMPEATRKWGRMWYEKLWSERPPGMASERWSGYLSRKQTHMHKLAMVLAAAQRNDLTIEVDDMVSADLILADVERDMAKVFERIGFVDEARNTAEIVQLVRAHKFLTSEQLWSMVMNNMRQQDFKNSLRAAVEGGILKKSLSPEG
jgi:hypothetical protein